MKMYYQCKLRRGNSETTGWIEERGAKVGAAVEVIHGPVAGHKVREFWTVTEVFEPPMDEASFKEHKALNRKSLPSVESIG